jgi:hypothetical protein
LASEPVHFRVAFASMIAAPNCLSNHAALIQHSGVTDVIMMLREQG